MVTSKKFYEHDSVRCEAVASEVSSFHHESARIQHANRTFSIVHSSGQACMVGSGLCEDEKETKPGPILASIWSVQTTPLCMR